MGTSNGERLTQMGSILGTPGYMAPEQVRGEEADSRSDQFSFCASLYEALYGYLPFGGESFIEYAENVLAGRRQSLPFPKRETKPDVPMVIEQALQRGLSLDPAARFTTMHELHALLSQGLQPDAESAQAQRTRRRALYGLVGVLSTFFAVRSVTLRYGGPPGPRSGMYVVWVALAMVGLCTVIFRKRIFRHAASRRLIYFGLLMMFGIATSRTSATALGIPMSQYLYMEIPWVMILFLLELPFVGRRYVWPILVCVGIFLLLLLVPEYKSTYMNPSYALLCILAVHGRLASTGAAKDRRAEPLIG
jgi:hypothetical protein